LVCNRVQGRPGSVGFLTFYDIIYRVVEESLLLNNFDSCLFACLLVSVVNSVSVYIVSCNSVECVFVWETLSWFVPLYCQDDDLCECGYTPCVCRVCVACQQDLVRASHCSHAFCMYVLAHGPARCSTLNGNNGSWTNTDDHDVAPKNNNNNKWAGDRAWRNNEAKRANKEANNHKLHSKGHDNKHGKVKEGPPNQGGQRRDPVGPPVNGAQAPVADKQQIPEEAAAAEAAKQARIAEAKEKKEQERVRKSKPLGIFTQEFPDVNGPPGFGGPTRKVIYGHIDGDLVDIGKINYPRDRLTPVLNEVLANQHTQFNYDDTGDVDKQKLVRGSEFLQRTFLARYRWYDDERVVIDEPDKHYFVYLPLLQKLQEKIPSVLLDVHTVNAVTALAVNQCKALKMFDCLRDSTVRYFLDRSHRFHVQLSNSLVIARKATKNGAFVGICDNAQYATVPQLAGRQDVMNPLTVVNAVRADNDYLLRKDFVIRNVHRYNHDQALHEHIPGEYNFVEDGQRGSKAQLVEFVGWRHPIDGKVRHITRMCDLHCNTTTQFAETGSVYMAALKRLIGCDEDEETYRANNFVAATMLKRAHSSNTSEAKNIRDSKVYARLTMDTWKRAHDDHDFLMELNRSYTDANDELHIHEGVMCSLSNFIKDKVSVGRMQNLIDTVYTGAHWAYHGAWKAFITRLPKFIRRHWVAEIIHSKRELRRRYVNGKKWSPDSDIFVRLLKAQIKRETAKAGKDPRLFVTYDAGCMYANDIPVYYKHCMHGQHYFEVRTEKGHFTCSVTIFAIPSSPELVEIFDRLYKARGTDHHMECVIFSDDQVVFFEGRMYEVDVSSNDSRQGLCTFYATYLALREFCGEEAEGLMEQCMLPIRATNPAHPEEFFDIQFSCPFEGSGSVLTTVLNHTGSLINLLYTFHVWAYGYGAKLDMVEYETHCIRKGALLNGHKVTVKYCEMFEQVTFLKHYGTMTPDGMIVSLCFGSVLKNFGAVNDDLVALMLGVSDVQFNSMPWSERMDRFLGSVILGLKNEPTYEALTVLRTRFPGTHSVKGEAINGSRKMLESGGELVNFQTNVDQGFLNRYGLTRAEVLEFVHEVGHLRVGQFIPTRLGRRVMHVDYDYPDYV